MVRISDKALLNLLIENAKRKYTEIAQILGVSEGAVRKRMAKLEREGIIKGYRAIVDIKALGYQIDAIVGVDTKAEAYLPVMAYLKRKKNVIQLWTSTGDHMLMFRAWFEDHKKLNHFIKELENVEGVERVCPAILVDEIK